MSAESTCTWQPGDQVRLPARFGMLAELPTPGRVDQVDDDWAMVDLGSYGIVGLPAADLQAWGE